MNETLFKEFLTSDDTLRIYHKGRLIFTSGKDRLVPLLEYLDEPGSPQRTVTIFDKITGNAAALLSIIAGCTEVFSPMGSEIAVKTLDKHSVRHHFTETVPYIRRPDSDLMCPMEELSLDKEPEEFHRALLKKIRQED